MKIIGKTDLQLYDNQESGVEVKYSITLPDTLRWPEMLCYIIESLPVMGYRVDPTVESELQEAIEEISSRFVNKRRG
jgi:hypothetical protein